MIEKEGKPAPVERRLTETGIQASAKRIVFAKK
jgi:hypothetical protein